MQLSTQVLGVEYTWLGINMYTLYQISKCLPKLSGHEKAYESVSTKFYSSGLSSAATYEHIHALVM